MKQIVKITLVAVAVTILGMTQTSAQKYGYIDFQELMTLMPDYKKANTEMEGFGKQLQDELKKMSVELEKKYDDYQKQEKSMPESIKELKQKELRDMQARIQEFQESAQENVRKKEQELLKPIVEKAKAAISQAAKEGGITYVFDSSPGTPLLHKPDGDNMMAAVKKKLGIL